MSKQLLIESINNFFEVIHDDQVQEKERITALVYALDLLALQTYRIEFIFDENDYPDPPFEENYTVTYRMIGQKFCSLGYYKVVDDINDLIGKTSFSIGDAIDDITDIYKALKDVLWYFENTSDDNGLYHFECLYRVHWRKHLRELQLCLNDWVDKQN